MISKILFIQLIYVVTIDGAFFSYTFAQIVFLSETVFMYFCYHQAPLVIDISSDDSLSSAEIRKCYLEFDKRFRKNVPSSITINHENKIFLLC